MSLCTVTPIVFSISVRCVTLILARIRHLKLGDAQEDGVALDPLDVDFPVLYPLCIHCVSEGGILRANDLDTSGRGCR